MTPETLCACLDIPEARAKSWSECLSAAMARYEINSPERKAAFLGLLAVESGRLVYVAEIWGPTKWQRAYDTNAGLGNTKPEAIQIAKANKSTPGRWWKGHGLIQVTGYDNHLACGKELGIDLANTPKLLEEPKYAALSAAWFFKRKGLNELADAWKIDAITRKVNGPGMLEADVRRTVSEKALKVLKEKKD